jgi:hypothetical protein
MTIYTTLGAAGRQGSCLVVGMVTVKFAAIAPGVLIGLFLDSPISGCP